MGWPFTWPSIIGEPPTLSTWNSAICSILQAARTSEKGPKNVTPASAAVREPSRRPVFDKRRVSRSTVTPFVPRRRQHSRIRVTEFLSVRILRDTPRPWPRHRHRRAAFLPHCEHRNRSARQDEPQHMAQRGQGASEPHWIISCRAALDVRAQTHSC